MDPKNQQYDGAGDYKPSGRASKAVNHAKSGGGGNGLVGDGPSSSQAFSSKGGDMPKPQPAGGKVPSQDAQSGSAALDNARSINDRRA